MGSEKQVAGFNYEATLPSLWASTGTTSLVFPHIKTHSVELKWAADSSHLELASLVLDLIKTGLI